MFWDKKEIKAQAELWKQERLGELKAEAQVLELLLRTTRDQIAELNSFEGRELAVHYGWLPPKTVEKTLSHREKFLDSVTEIWIEWEHKLKKKP